MPFRKIIVVSLVLGGGFAANAAAAQDGPLFRFAEQPGPYGVGLKVVHQFDQSRTFHPRTDELGKPYTGERARPIQTLIWYPAERQPGAKPITVGDYANLWASETSFDKPKVWPLWNEWREGMAPLLGSALWAVPDAPEKSGRFPVVIYAPSFSAMGWENADLCEYLASHGYVVIASPDLGTTTRGMTGDVAGVNTQARDISFLISYAHTLSNTDLTKIAVAGFSWGGISNLFAAARDNRIDALVALDGSMRYWSDLIQEAGDVHPGQMTIPLLYFAQGEFPLEMSMRYLKKNAGPNPLNEWTHGDLLMVRMLGMTHTQFSSMYQRNQQVWATSFLQERKADYGREDAIEGYAWVARYTLQFLNAYLKADAGALAFLKRTPAENDAPKHFMDVTYRAAEGIPVSFESFRAEVGRQGFDRIPEIVAAMKKQQNDFRLEESVLGEWAQELISTAHLKEAIALLELNARLYPDSSGAYALLGKAYEQSGQKKLAIGSYRKSLEKNPGDPDVTRRLKALSP